MNAPIDVSGVQLHTQRLTLRPWRQSDLEDFFDTNPQLKLHKVPGI